jgi:DNA-binding MarR family transcriptional regulator
MRATVLLPRRFAMTDDILFEQAAQLESLLPRVMRKLFTLEQDHPATELPLSQLRVCMILQNGPRSLSALSEELGISVSAVTQLTDRLERAGFVERTAEEEDRRMKRVAMTAQGDALMKARRRTRVQRAENALAGMAPEERTVVLNALELLLASAQATAPHNNIEDPVGARLEH